MNAVSSGGRDKKGRKRGDLFTESQKAIEFWQELSVPQILKKTSLIVASVQAVLSKCGRGKPTRLNVGWPTVKSNEAATKEMEL